MREEDDMERSGGRDREKSSGYTEGEGARTTKKRHVEGTLRGSRSARALRKRGREGGEADRVRSAVRWGTSRWKESGGRGRGRRHVEGGCEVTSRRVDTHSYYSSACGDTVTPR